jgi:exoribonuclease R
VPHPRVRLVADGAALRAGFAAVRTEFGVPAAFPPEVLAAADAAAERLTLTTLQMLPTSPTPPTPARNDATDVPFLTIDPPGSTDLDQAMHIERRPARGYRVRYAIADVAAFVRPGDAIDTEARRRGESYYSPDVRVPLYPPVLGDDAASLLPDQPRPALVWTIDLDADGEQTDVDVRRAVVRSRARLDYAGAQQRRDDDTLTLLAEVGKLRIVREIDRGAVSLRLPEQEVDADGDGFRLRYRASLPIEEWNAQISLLTGMAAAKLMLEARVGILRTLPPPDPGAIAMLRRSARALDVDWPQTLTYQAFVRRLDPASPAGAALLELATRLLRGAAYVAFDGTAPASAVHSAVAAPYAHATAPLRRLVDRYVGEVCVAVCAGEPVPDDVRSVLPDLPEIMAAGDRRAHEVEHACVDLVECALLAPHVGQTFSATVVERDHHGGVVQVRTPAVRARCGADDLPLGERIDVRLVQADLATRSVRFARA